MYTWICPQCGREVPPSSDACPDCVANGKSGAPPVFETLVVETAAGGTPAAAPPIAPSITPSRGRVASHLRMLMVFWLAQGVLRLFGTVPGLLLWFPVGMPSGMAQGLGSFLQFQSPLSNAGWAFVLVSSVWTVACLVVAWGLLDRKPWARTYTIIVSAIWLLSFPLGTALSIYTLWVLLPETSENEYRELAMP
jgi:hypothetical protein